MLIWSSGWKLWYNAVIAANICFPSQESIISARQRLEDAVAVSLRSHQSSSLAAERPDKGGLRTGVAPGAFPSLLEHTLDPTGLRTLSEEVRIQQVALHAHVS